jgi:hypothetical protein
MIVSSRLFATQLIGSRGVFHKKKPRESTHGVLQSQITFGICFFHPDSMQRSLFVRLPSATDLNRLNRCCAGRGLVGKWLPLHRRWGVAPRPEA